MSVHIKAFELTATINEDGCVWFVGIAAFHSRGFNFHNLYGDKRKNNKANKTSKQIDS